MSDRKDLHSPIMRARIAVFRWIDALPKEAQPDAVMAVDKLVDVAGREIEQAYSDGYNNCLEANRARPFIPK